MTNENSICERISPPNRITVNPPIVNAESANVGASSQVPPPEIPENHFLKWLHDKMVNEDIVINLGYNECKYITEFIRSEEARQWTANTPVFISSQTGSGKTTFVYDVLIKEIILKSQSPNDKVLLLCNRVALSRQCKYKAAKWQKNFRKNISYEKLLAKYHASGIDEDCHDFGSIHIYTYHQIYHKFLKEKSGNNEFSLNDYKYIVFDECHFFTSDSRFNSETASMLHTIATNGREAVRIYMSATPEVVFAPIITMEYSFVENRRRQLQEDALKAFNDDFPQRDFNRQSFIKGTDNLQFAFIAHENNGYVQYQDNYTKNMYIQKVLGELSEETAYDRMVKELQEQLSACNLPIYFYYMDRNYDYIQNIKTYENKDELFNEISRHSSPKDKWMVFVSSKKDGVSLCNRLNGKADDSHSTGDDAEDVHDISTNTPEQDNAAFICSKNKETDLCAMEAFSDIIEDEKFKRTILITTSVLDNGINIKDNNVHNIAIDVFDRTEFLQMLGRLRIDDSEQRVNLYIRKYTYNELKSEAKKTASNLIQRLKINYLSKSEQIEEYKRCAKGNTIFDDEMYRLLDDTSKRFCTYNSFSIYQLIDYLSMLISIIRTKNPDFVIHYYESDDAELWRGKLVESHLKTYREYSPWSRSIIDLLGSREDMESRKEYKRNDLIRHIISSRYEYTFFDTFANFLFSEAIPECINLKIKQMIDIGYFNWLPSDERKSEERNLFDSLLQQVNAHESNCPYFEVWNQIWEAMNQYEHKNFEHLTCKIASMAEKIEFYKKLANNIPSDPIDLQYQWIGKQIVTKESTVPPQNIEDFIKNANTPTIEELENVKSGDYYDESFLKKHNAIPINKKIPTQQETEFSNTYLKGAPLASLREKLRLKVDGIEYMLTSRTSTGSRTTYYLFVKINSNHTQDTENPPPQNDEP